MPEQQPAKRRVGRPSEGKPRKPRIDITLSQETANFLRAYGATGGNVSAFIEALIQSSTEYGQWEDSRLSS